MFHIKQRLTYPLKIIILLILVSQLQLLTGCAANQIDNNLFHTSRYYSQNQQMDETKISDFPRKIGMVHITKSLQGRGPNLSYIPVDTLNALKSDSTQPKSIHFTSLGPDELHLSRDFLQSLALTSDPNKSYKELIEVITKKSSQHDIDAVLIIETITTTTSKATGLSGLDLTMVGALIIPSTYLESETLASGILISSKENTAHHILKPVKSFKKGFFPTFSATPKSIEFESENKKKAISEIVKQLTDYLLYPSPYASQTR
jgi:hypothetical protein